MAGKDAAVLPRPGRDRVWSGSRSPVAVLTVMAAEGAAFAVLAGLDGSAAWRVARVLVEAAAEADLLVVGCRGRGGLTEALLGSVGRYCARHASCPVVVMRGKH